MSISRIQAIESGNNVPKVDIDSTKNNVPKFSVDLQGGASPIDLQSITITENGTTEAPDGVAYNEIEVNVPQTTLASITITENGTTTAPIGTAYNEIIVDVPPVEPTTKVVSEFDFSQQEYDLIRSINPESLEPREKALLFPNLYNANYNSENGYVAWSNYYGNIQPKFFINPFKNYVIEIDFGVVGNDYQSASDREIFSIGDQMKLYWNTQGYFSRENSSGYERWTDLDTRDYLTNRKLIVSIEWALSGTNEPTCYVYLMFDNGDDTFTTKFFGNWDGVGYPTLVVGRRTSDNGLYPVQVKGIKITERKWIIE